MNGKYNQPTAHMLQPVKGWDSMAHLDFVAPIASTVADALPGTVMHLNSMGELEPGLTAQGMGMYLFYKMWDEDVQPYPLTEDGTRMTAVGMQSFGGYNSEVYLRTWDGDSYNTNGHASNVGAYQFNADGSATIAKVKAGTSAHTTYPAICGMELSSTEFASSFGDGSAIVYVPNDTLTSPLPAAFVNSNTVPGTQAQQTAGGFLKKGECYKDPICGIVSKKPVINEHGYKQICFWSTWLPAATRDKPVAGASLTVSSAGTLIWHTGSADSFDDYFVSSTNTVDNLKTYVAFTGNKNTTYSADTDLFVKLDQTSSGAAPQDCEFKVLLTTGGADVPVEIGGPTVEGVTASMVRPSTVKLHFSDAAGAPTKLIITYKGLTKTVEALKLV